MHAVQNDEISYWRIGETRKYGKEKNRDIVHTAKYVRMTCTLQVG